MTAAPRLHVIAADSRRTELAPVSDFAASLGRVSWFAGAGQELTQSEIQEARDYLAGLGLARAGVAGVRSWHDAESITRDPRWDASWWTAEETLRRRLRRSAQRDWGERPLMTALTRVTDEATRVTLGAAALATARDGVADPALARVAAGAASQAAYQYALALAAGADAAHPFAVKFRLFAAGRWLLGLVDETFYLF